MHYFVFFKDDFYPMSLHELAEDLSLERRISTVCIPGVWSARLSTGIFGYTGCDAGNRGPKGYNEVMLALGDEGLNELVRLGFVPCPSCHPEKAEGFWESINDTVQAKYGIRRLEAFLGLPFDARRVEWEEVLPIVKGVPGRLYVPEGLAENELIKISTRFAVLGYAVPDVGYYKNGFRRYEMP